MSARYIADVRQPRPLLIGSTYRDQYGTAWRVLRRHIDDKNVIIAEALEDGPAPWMYPAGATVQFGRHGLQTRSHLIHPEPGRGPIFLRLGEWMVTWSDGTVGPHPAEL